MCATATPTIACCEKPTTAAISQAPAEDRIWQDKKKIGKVKSHLHNGTLAGYARYSIGNVAPGLYQPRNSNTPWAPQGSGEVEEGASKTFTNEGKKLPPS